MNMNELAQKWTKYLLADDSEIDFRIKAGPEMYRKGFGKFTLADSQGRPVENAEIALELTRHEYHFGCNAFMLDGFPEPERNREYEELFASLFNLAVVPLFWSDLEPEQGKPRFAKDSQPIARRPPIDLVLEFCERHGITPKGHPLWWKIFQPQWLSTDKRLLAGQIERRFKEIASRYGERVKIWDVVNEAQTWNENNRFPPCPESHVDFAFKCAERHFPMDSALTYNDDRIWFSYQEEYTPVYLLVKRLLDNGRKVDGLGLQYHMTDYLLQNTSKAVSPRNIYKCLDLYGKLGVPVNFSEVSVIGMPELGDGDAFQELVAERLYRLWFAHPATNGIIWWNMVDNTGAWESSNKLRAGLLNNDLTPKPAFKMLRRLIKEEWTTKTSIAYVEGGDNRFHGFHGDYKAVIKTNEGVCEKKVSLRKSAENEFHLAFALEAN